MNEKGITMKRLSLLWLALTVVVGAAFAAPVDVNHARSCGQKYVYNTLGQKSAELSLAYTCVSEAGTDALYVFNYGQGFVVVAADDRACPILAYGTDQEFDVNNLPEGMRYYLNYYARQIQFAIDNDLPYDPEIADQWYWVEKEGVTRKTRGEKAVQPLLTTLWDQDWPYNYYAPACSSYWTNNHCYAGCVATAMSQAMKYWNWPETGVGEHSYSTSSYGGTLSANFGEATYNWDIMPNQLGSQANQAAMAVALLMYHCGIAVDMDYAPDGSGAHTEDVAPALIEYFRYGAGCHIDSRDNYTRTTWEDILIAQLDRHIPFVYAGSDTNGGHAFNLDGYNDQRMFHFNWGWSGSYQSTYYQIDALNTGNGHFNSYQRAVFDIIPDYIYNAMVPAIESMEVSVVDALTHDVTVRWTVPSESVSGDPLTSIQKIELKRNGEVIQTYDNPNPGEVITFEETLPEYGPYKYTLSGMNYDLEGEPFSQIVILGPNCTWKFVCQTTNFQGWNEGKIQVVGSNGVVFKEVTMTNSTPVSDKFQMPEGDFSLNWVAPPTEVSSLTITLKNSAGQTVYTYSGSSTQLNGTVFSGTNDCEGCQPPTNLAGEYQYTDEGFGTFLTWTYDVDPKSFKVYRSTDGAEYELVATVDKEAREYFDIAPVAEYYYKVTAFTSACETTPAITASNTDFVYVVVTSVGENDIKANIYPNPAKDNLSIQAVDIDEVTVYNLMGQTVYRYNGRTNSLDINTSHFEAGIYTVNVMTANGLASKRVMVMH